jgi:Sec-independent protein translocase protein TatA
MEGSETAEAAITNFRKGLTEKQDQMEEKNQSQDLVEKKRKIVEEYQQTFEAPGDIM